MADYVEGVIAEGEELWLTDASGTLIEVKGLEQIREPSFMVEEVEDTDMGSGGVKDYLAGLGDWNQFQAVIKHRPGSDTHLLIEEHLMSKEKRPFEVVLRAKNDGSTVTGKGIILLTGYEKPSRSVGSKNTATLSGRVSRDGSGAARYEEGAVQAPEAA